MISHTHHNVPESLEIPEIPESLGFPPSFVSHHLSYAICVAGVGCGRWGVRVSRELERRVPDWGDRLRVSELAGWHGCTDWRIGCRYSYLPLVKEPSSNNVIELD